MSSARSPLLSLALPNKIFLGISSTLPSSLFSSSSSTLVSWFKNFWSCFSVSSPACNLLLKSPTTFAIPFLVWLHRLCHLCLWGISTLFCADSMQDMFLMPLNSSKILCFFPCWFFLSLTHFLKCSLTSFKCCFSPLAVFLLVSISFWIWISASLMLTSSFSPSIFFAAAGLSSTASFSSSISTDSSASLSCSDGLPLPSLQRSRNHTDPPRRSPSWDVQDVLHVSPLLLSGSFSSVVSVFFWSCFEFCCRYPLCRRCCFSALQLSSSLLFVHLHVVPDRILRLHFLFDLFFELLVSFFERGRFLITVLFIGLGADILHFIPLLVIVCIMVGILFLCINHECCHNTSVVAAHVDDVIGFSIFTESQVSSFDQFVINLFLCSFKQSVCSLLSRRFSVHRVECCKVLHHQPLSHPVSSFVTFIECMRTNTYSFHSIAWSQFGTAVSSHNLNALLAGIRVLLNCLVRFFSIWWSASPEWEKYHAHQHDALMVDCDRCFNDPFADVFSVSKSFSPFYGQ